jgi:hypothetical protein
MNSHRRNVWGAAAVIAAMLLIGAAAPSEAGHLGMGVRTITNDTEPLVEVGANRQDVGGFTLRQLGQMLLMPLIYVIPADDLGWKGGPARQAGGGY